MFSAMSGAVAIAPSTVRSASTTRRAGASASRANGAIRAGFKPVAARPARRHSVSMSFGRESIRARTVVRCAPPPSGTAETKDEDSSAPDSSADPETSSDEEAKLADALEAIAKEREILIEREEETKKKENQALDKQADLELVAQKSAQLAAKAWEDVEEWNESVKKAMAKSDAAFEAMGQAEMFVKEIKEKQAILEIALAAECEEDDIPCVDEAIDDAKGKKDDAEEAEKKEPVKKVKKSEQWWLAEDLTMDDAIGIIAERLAEAEAAFEKACAEKTTREDKYVEAVKSAEEAKEEAEAADQRAASAMTVVDEMMETVMEARMKWSEAEAAIVELDAKAAKLRGVDPEAAATPVEEECEEDDEECIEAMVAAKPVEQIPGGVEAAAAAKEAEEKTAEKEVVEEKAKPEIPKPQSSSKQFAGKFFSSSGESAKGASLAAGIALAVSFFFGMFHPAAQPVRTAVGGTAAQVTATVENGWKGFVANIPESERKIAEHAYEEAHEAGLLDALVLLFTSIFAVTLVSKIPGGSPVLGFLLGGAAVGPYMLGFVDHVAQAKVLAEFGVVFLLFNIGLELSYERLQSMARYIFGMGSMQMLLTTVGIAVAAVMCGLTIPQAVVIGMGLAFSSTAVALQVLQDRGETGARHGRATFSVLLFQDLTVVLVFMLVPLLAGPDSGSVSAIAGSLIKAIFKTVVAIGAIMVAGRAILRPVYNRIASLKNAEVLTATTLFTALGTSLLTQSLGLSMALGAFLAGLLLAETEFHLQVESDIAPFRGLLLGLFFMTVGMQIDPGTLFANFGSILAIAVGLLAVKMGVMAICGPMFGLSMLAALRSGVYVAPGGEFAFVTFGLAASAGLLSMGVVNQINLAVVLTMAMTPLLANAGAMFKNFFKKESSVASLQAKEGDANDLSGHVIIAGYGRVGRMIGELLNTELIPFVGLDASADAVSQARASDLPVYFGDAGSEAVLHAVGAEKASCAVVTLDTPTATFRAVWTLKKNFPHIKVYARASDIAQGLELEQAGAKAVVPETLEPSLQLAAAVLSEMEMSNEDISIAVDNFRRSHMGELQILAASSGSALGYGLPTDLQSIDLEDSDGLVEVKGVAAA
jgi:monovalent cation:proton antiporter-2 (CPA2) family protein